MVNALPRRPLLGDAAANALLKEVQEDLTADITGIETEQVSPDLSEDH
jgi:hypothetical protein